MCYKLAVLKQHGRLPYFPTGPLHLSVVAFTPLPKDEQRKRNPPAARYDFGHRGDLSNIVKGLEDAGNGILWHDDCQIASLTASKWVCAQGEEPYTKVCVRTINTDFRL
jgi:Holliday junction resolvase RusA-like endonuclease